MFENKDICDVVMSSEDTKILEFNQYQESDKRPSIIYADLKSLLKIVDGCKNKPEKLSATKVGKHIPSWHSMPTICTFDGIENKHDVYRGEDCMKKVCESLREEAININNIEKK